MKIFHGQIYQYENPLLSKSTNIFLMILLLSICSALHGRDMKVSSKIYVAGHTGLVGSALVRELRNQGYNKIITRSRAELDLRNQEAVNKFFEQEKPEFVFLAAAKVGGIKANSTKPADFIYDNLIISINIIHAAYRHGVKKLLFLGSSCIYPRECPQPILEEYLLTSELEKTNEPYALAKIAGLKLCESYHRQYGSRFISCMPTNLYGIGDNFDFETSHVLPALIAKMHKAKIEDAPYVELWGSGMVRREFLYVDDCAKACIFLIQNYEGSTPINVGCGYDISIKELAYLVKEVIGYTGEIRFNHNGLDGTPQKLLNVDKINKLGWHAQISLLEGIQKTYAWYQDHTSFSHVHSTQMLKDMYA